MLNNLSNKKLAVIFGVLVVIAAVFYFTDEKNERTFRQELVDIDTTEITEILIYPKSQNHAEIKIFKENDSWKTTLTNGKVVSVPDSKADNLINQILSIKPKRLAARGSQKWTEFEVDSTATRVKIIEDGKETLNILLGKFAFQQPRSMSTYVRLNNDSDVYEVDGFLSATFNQGISSFRDNSIITGDYKNWNRISFNYPADSSYQLVKLNDIWFANDEPTDSVETAKYLSQLQRLTSSYFTDDVDAAIVPTHKLTVETESGEILEVKGFQQIEHFPITSNLNPDSYFEGTQNNLGKKAFIGYKQLLK
ncbi:MAG: DUF4340 domain-containing protein [Bacteroidetes bacterium]|nr:DUF4340 domain-containing protein [Bacteroidota bacterium]MBU1678942.1 DUF4340 domain-containing protein [Bacteroidota bacterium]MBU2507414.1 DUF4340 domain-containing protein [Bacteroidota bacterium]